jgi:soluble lytic murein transglycosylase
MRFRVILKIQWIQIGLGCLCSFFLSASAFGQERMPVSPRVSLVPNLVTPADVELVNEIGLRLEPSTELSLDMMAGWIKSSLTSSEKSQLIAECDNLTEKFSQEKDKSWIQKHPACVPRYLEQRANADKAGKVKEKTLSPLVGVRRAQDFITLKNVEFPRAFLALDPKSAQELALYGSYLKPFSGNCDFKGAFSALIARSETFFPHPEAKQVLEDFYRPSFLCLNEADPGYERTHLRVGLFRLLEGRNDEARRSLLLASQATNPEEEFRSLFWLGVLADESKPASAGDSSLPLKHKDGSGVYWNLLRHRYPVTLHSILASHAMGIDPLERFKGTQPVYMRRRSASADQLTTNLVSFVFEILLSRREFLAADRWSDFVSSKLPAPSSEEQILYLAWCHNQVQKHRSSIALLAKYMKLSSQEGYNVTLLDMMFPRAYSEEILKETDKVDPVLVFALVRQESAFDAQARSSADARGLMQLLPSTAKRWLPNPRKDLYSPSQNILAGVSYLETLLQKYGGTVEHVLAAYNAGPGNVDKWKRRLSESNTLLFSDLIPFKETRTYVAIILRNAYWYGRLLVQLDDELAQKVIKLSGQSIWKSKMVHNLLKAAWGTHEGADEGLAAISGLYQTQKQAAFQGPIEAE